jgi:hypothetical protein
MAQFRFHGRGYIWRQVGECWELFTSGNLVAQVVPDSVYPGMYRVRVGDGPLSDMVNLPRAKDAAVSLHDRSVGICPQTSRGASPIRVSDRAGIDHHPDAPLLPGLDMGDMFQAQTFRRAEIRVFSTITIVDLTPGQPEGER